MAQVMVEERLQDVPLSCGCGAQWVGKLLVGVEVERAAAHMVALRCPVCRGRNVVLITGAKGDDCLVRRSVKDTEILDWIDRQVVAVERGPQGWSVTWQNAAGEKVLNAFDSGLVRPALASAWERARLVGV